LVASIAAFAAVPLQQRLQAAMYVASVQEIKAADRVGRDLQLPLADSVEQATANLAKIACEAAADGITPAVARDLADLQQRFIDAKTGQDVEARLEALEAALARFRPAIPIVVESSMPTMPGLEGVRMPERLEASPDGGRNRESEP
jgi:hypothetical protein